MRNSSDKTKINKKEEENDGGEKSRKEKIEN